MKVFVLAFGTAAAAIATVGCITAAASLWPSVWGTVECVGLRSSAAGAAVSALGFTATCLACAAVIGVKLTWDALGDFDFF